MISLQQCNLLKFNLFIMNASIGATCMYIIHNTNHILIDGYCNSSSIYVCINTLYYIHIVYVIFMDEHVTMLCTICTIFSTYVHTY